MNAMRAARRWFRVRVSRAPQAAERLLHVAVALLCVGVFACFFLIGREGKRSDEPARASAGAPIQSVRGAVPLRLDDAPPIETIARVRVRETSPAVEPAPQSSSSVAGESQASSPPTPTAPTVGNGSPDRAGGTTKVRSSGGVPFESSG
jgi:hypothetical protein